MILTDENKAFLTEKLKQAFQGGTAGAIGAGVIKGAGALAEPIKNQLGDIGQKAVQTLREAGVPVDVAQATGSAFLNRTKAALMDNPFTAGKEEAFSAFANKYPKSPYLPLALYWGGNSKYANKDYAGAISQLQSLIKRYPNHPRIPAAMVTLGNSQLESCNKAAAKKTFSEIIAKYPDTDAAKDAQQLIAATK